MGCGRPLVSRLPVLVGAVDEVILGCAAPLPDELNPARVATLRLGLGERTPAWTVQRQCGSGLQALDTARRAIADGRAGLILAGGAESLSRAPLLWRDETVHWLADWRQARGFGARLRLLGRLRPRLLAPVIGLLRGLTDPVCGLDMGQTAEVLAHRFDIDRASADAYAAESHRRTARARREGWLDDEIVPLIAADGTVYDHDDGVREDTDAARLGRLKPAFERPHGKVTAGNASQITDGATWLILAGPETVARHDLPVLGRLGACTWAALDPVRMGLGPVFAATRLLDELGLTPEDIDAWELNEAFAAQVLACLAAWRDPDFCRDELGRAKPFGEIPAGRLNVDGGAIGIGHPVGASGARLVLHLLHLLRRERWHRGVATLCIGGGQGGAMLVERETDA